MSLGHDFVDEALGGFQQPNSFWKTLGNIASSFLPFGSLIDSGINLISGISNNLYSRRLQQTMFNRDDTAMDRLMAQYERNGVNPLLAVPGVTQGNTKAFEPGQVSSNFAELENQRLAREQFKKNNQLLDKQIEQLEQTMRLNKNSTDMDLALKQAELNGYIDYSNKHQLSSRFTAVKPAESKSDWQKLAEWIYNFMSGNGSEKPDLPFPTSSSPKPTAEEKNREATRVERAEGLYKTAKPYMIKNEGLSVISTNGVKQRIPARFVKEKGSKVQYLELKPDFGKDWIRFYNDQELYDWLDKQSLSLYAM